MYRLTDPVTVVSGIGPAVTEKLANSGITTVQDLALYLPFRYEDLSHFVTIDQLLVGETATLKATVLSASSSWRGRRKMTRATIGDETGKTKCIWFNNRFVEQKLKKGGELFFSGKYTDRKMLVQPTVERASADTIHTGRLVPIYPKLNNDIPMGSLRRWLKNITDNLEKIKLPQHQFFPSEIPDLVSALKVLHFPDELDEIIPARESLALEEMLGLIRHSQKIKQDWKDKHQAVPIQIKNPKKIPKTIPFKLTIAQTRSTQEILSDIQNDVAMNRLLVGDVGSGKTVVAGMAAFHILQNNHSAVLVAPTQILAQQHQETFGKLFPDLKTQIVTTKNSKKISKELAETQPATQIKLFIGTHAVLNKLDLINPALIIYDEQHRFGVSQRTTPITEHGFTPHILTMTATPIPRSLMLTLFSHLQLSSIDEMPPGRIPTQTWLVPKSKRKKSLEWLAKEIEKTNGQAMVVCPFIEPSKNENFANVAAATDLFKELQKFYAKSKTASQLNLGLLHGRLPAKQKDQVITDLFAKKINLLVTTPVVEVGVDLPKANIIVIEASERFGLASLHQLRGRVGRSGQESYCLLFTNSKNEDTKNRLKTFTKENNGLKLAEKDLETRGAGELFGFRQSGFSDLRFASWANVELIQTAHQIHTQLETNNTKWQPLMKFESKNKNPGNN